jgi:hypothetical protein
MEKNLTELSEKELLIDQIKILSNVNKNLKTLTTIMVFFSLFVVFGSILLWLFVQENYL